MEKVSSLSYFGTQIRERRQIWVNRKAESPDTTCDQYAYSCHEAIQLAAATNFRGFSCRCIDKARGMREKMQAQKALDAALNRFGALPKGLSGMTFETYAQSPDWRKDEADSALHALKTCLTYGDGPDKPFLTIFGPVGAGKTHLAMAIAQATVLVPTWANCPEMLSYLRSTFDKDVAASFHQELERIKASPLLVIDDLSAERQTEWATEQIYQIINYRHMNKLPTVITSNDDVLKMVGRIGSRIRDYHTGQVVRLDVDDNRLRLPRRR